MKSTNPIDIVFFDDLPMTEEELAEAEAQLDMDISLNYEING